MKNINDLRANLIDAIIEVKSGKMKPETAKIICAQTQTVLNLTKLEMLYKRDKKDMSDITFMKYDKNTINTSGVIPAQNIDKSKHKELMKDERYKNNCNDCLHLQSIESVIPAKINCSFGDKLECVLLNFDTCKKLNP